MAGGSAYQDHQAGEQKRGKCNRDRRRSQQPLGIEFDKPKEFAYCPEGNRVLSKGTI